MSAEKKDGFVDFTYEMKCRKCNKISSIWVANSKHMEYLDFVNFMGESSKYPKQNQCSCSNGSIMFHDVISYSPIYV